MREGCCRGVDFSTPGGTPEYAARMRRGVVGMFAAMVVLLVPALMQPLRAQAGAEGAGGVTRTTGVDAGSGIAYVFVSVEGKVVSGAGEGQPVPPPRLSAQCTRDPGGKLRFELLADLGGVPELVYFPPWKQSRNDLYPPTLARVGVTMEFLGYTKVKPVKRQWEFLNELPGEMRYAAPGLGSGNMEPVMFYLQYLRALPTLRLTPPGKGTVEFATTRWQEGVRAEPLCGASGL